MFHRIVVGFDGSDSSRRALEDAVRLAKLTGAEMLVVMVEEHLPKYPSAMSETTEEREAIDTYFAELEREAEALGRDTGVPLGVRIVAGNAPKLLCDVAKEVRADLLVIGASGRSGLWAGVLGTTADKVVDHAPCSVLVVRQWHN
ncbi:MAG TPA: universal stress protein [Gemmatimonadales bacterium]|nr:universal stress protein [Gemmatimonadales bacterium]